MSIEEIRVLLDEAHSTLARIYIDADADPVSLAIIGEVHKAMAILEEIEDGR